MYWILLYSDLVDDYVLRRAEHRAAHLALAEDSRRRGFLQLGGALEDPVDGAVLVFKANDKAVIEQFVRDDPYVVNGLVGSWTIRRWNVVVGDQPPAGGFGQSRSYIG